MKPVVRQVDGEWRVWMETGRKDRAGKVIYVGDLVQERGREPHSVPVGHDSNIYASIPVVIESPGLLCEVESPECECRECKRRLSPALCWVCILLGCTQHEPRCGT